MNQPEKCCQQLAQCSHRDEVVWCEGCRWKPRHPEKDCPERTQTAPSHEGKEFAGASYVSEKCCPRCIGFKGQTAKSYSEYCRKALDCICHKLDRTAEIAPKQSSGIEEIVRTFGDGVEAFWLSPSAGAFGKKHAQDWLRVTLTSFESRIRAQEREQIENAREQGYQDGLYKGCAQELTRIADLIEGNKYKNVRDTSMNASDDPDYEAEHQTSWNAAVEAILNLIRGK